MPHQWKCSKCDFKFISGNFGNSISAYCLMCGTVYGIAAKENWGFVTGDVCGIYTRLNEADTQVGETKAIKTGSINAHQELIDRCLELGHPIEWAYKCIEFENSPKFQDIVEVPIDFFICVNCKSKKLEYWIKRDSDCPKCKNGKIDHDGVIMP